MRTVFRTRPRSRAAKGHEGAARPGATPTMLVGDPAANPVFARTPLSVNGTASIGTQIVAADLDHDGDIDLAVAGKLGVHVLENLKVERVPKAIRESTQPLNRAWPFPGEGKEIEQEDGPAVIK